MPFKDPDKRREYHRKYNHEWHLKRRDEPEYRARRSAVENSAKMKLYRAKYMGAWFLRKKFGMSTTQYEDILKSQNGLCAICHSDNHDNRKRGNRRDPLNKTKALGVDHDHKTGQVRGLLCDSCNRALGLMHDDPALLIAAASYLMKCNLRLAS